jgi:hypothetical protein
MNKANGLNIIRDFNVYFSICFFVLMELNLHFYCVVLETIITSSPELTNEKHNLPFA